jgi:hypothetical protein
LPDFLDLAAANGGTAQAGGCVDKYAVALATSYESKSKKSPAPLAFIANSP